MPTRTSAATREATPAPTSGAPAVSASGVGKRFGYTWALRDVDLEVRSGELLALMGPNGAGKSTLLRVLATLLKPTRGEARVFGERVDADANAVRERTSFLAPEGFLYGDLTAMENLRFAARMYGLEEWRDPAARVLERVGLQRSADVRVDGFSSGMYKRLALARLLLQAGDLVLLDEPYASLDAEGIDLVDRLVEEMQGEGKTVLLASHQWGRALHLSDRVVVLEGGRIAWTGTPREAESRLPGSGRG